MENKNTKNTEDELEQPLKQVFIKEDSFNNSGNPREFDELRIKKIGGFFGVTIPVCIRIYDDDAQTAAHYTAPFFINNHYDRAYEVIRVTERHEVAGNDAGAVTLMLKKVPSGTAPSSGTDILTAGISLKATADTNQFGTISGIISSRKIGPGDSLSLVTTGTLTNLKGVTVAVLLKAI